MPTSDGSTRQGAPVLRRLGAILAALAVFVAVDVALCLALEPYGAHTEIVWNQYRQAQGLNTIVVGASTAAYDMDPRVIDEELGATSFNLGTPGQSLNNTLASLEAAAHEHKLDRAIVCLGYETMAGVPFINSSVVFTQAKCLGESPAAAMGDIARLVFDDYYFPKIYSLSCAFPWAYDHVDLTVENIATNVLNRLRGNVIAAGESYNRMIDDPWRYETQGFGGVQNTRPASIAHGTSFVHYKGESFFEGNVESLRQMCEFCREQGIPLYVVACPYTPSAILEYGSDYLRYMAPLKNLVEATGAHYFDLNMIHRDLLDLQLTSYCDQVHLSATGAPQATSALCALIQKAENGEDVSGLFYDYSEEGWRNWRDSLDFVDSVDYAYEIDAAGNARITAQARTGSKTPVAYQYETYDASTDSWKVVRGFSDDPALVLERADGTAATIRITARATNGRQDQDRTVEGPIVFN